MNKINIIENKKNIVSDSEDEVLEFTTDEKKNHTEMENIVKDFNEEAKTNILQLLRFKTKTDEFVFNHLPLSDAQKEELVLSVLSENKLSE
jgi:hypothetical protein